VAKYTAGTKWKYLYVNSSSSTNTDNCLKCNDTNIKNICFAEFCFFALIHTIPIISRRLVTFRMKLRIGMSD